MKEYFQSPVPYVPALLFGAFIFGAMGIAFIPAAEPLKVVFGFICLGILGGFYWLVYVLVRRATVRIVGESIWVRGLMGRLHYIQDVREYSLVLSKDWIGFRRPGSGDIMLEQRRFPKEAWSKLEQELRQLPFVSIV